MGSSVSISPRLDPKNGSKRLAVSGVTVTGGLIGQSTDVSFLVTKQCGRREDFIGVTYSKLLVLGLPPFFLRGGSGDP